MRHSPDLSDTNTSIVIYCDKMEIIIIIIFKKQKNDNNNSSICEVHNVSI